MSERVLALFAHPDDETLAAGATLAKHIEAGDHVAIVVFTDGVAARRDHGGPLADIGAFNIRNAEYRRACKILGTEDIYIHRYADNAMDNTPRITVTEHIKIHLERVKPTLIYTHWVGDMNVDHQQVAEATLTACRPLDGCTVKRIMMGEVPSSTEWGTRGAFAPNWYENAEYTFETKMEAMRCYVSEHKDYPHPRSLEAVRSLAQWRGANCGMVLAEAFILARNVA